MGEGQIAFVVLCDEIYSMPTVCSVHFAELTNIFKLLQLDIEIYLHLVYNNKSRTAGAVAAP